MKIRNMQMIEVIGEKDLSDLSQYQVRIKNINYNGKDLHWDKSAFLYVFDVLHQIEEKWYGDLYAVSKVNMQKCECIGVCRITLPEQNSTSSVQIEILDPDDASFCDLFYDEKQHILAAPNDDMDSLYVDDTQYELEIRMRKVNMDDLSTD